MLMVEVPYHGVVVREFRVRAAVAQESAVLGKSTDGPYDTDSEPETYATIREDTDLIALDRITPEGDVVWHKYDHLPNLLEAEARERQQRPTRRARGLGHDSSSNTSRRRPLTRPITRRREGRP